MLEFVKLWDASQTLEHTPSSSIKYRYTICSDKNQRTSLHINLTDLREISGLEKFWNNGQLKNFYFLDVLHNSLKSLPMELSNVGSTLAIAGLAFNCFEVIPEQIFHCTVLNTLNLCSNEIKIVSREVSNLQNLTTLALSNNQIQYLPDIFGSFPLLEILFVDGNYLTVLPPSFERLQAIKTLNLRSNFLKSFPKCLYNLTTLKSLYLAENRIQIVPHSAHVLIKNLGELTLHGNPLQNSELHSLQDSELLYSLQNSGLYSLQNSELCQSFRVLVTGECGSGKTSLVQAFCQDKYVTAVEREEHDHTVGINRYRWRSTRDDPFDIVVWDFAGENSYSMMHQMFQSVGTLTWLVVNAKQYNFNTSIKPWLQSALSYSEYPQIWIVCTHSDLYNVYQQNVIKSKIKADIQTMCESLQKSSAAGIKLEHLPVICVTNTFSRDGHGTLKNHLINCLRSGICKREMLADTWAIAELHLKEKAMHMITEGKPPIVKISDLEGVVQDFNDPLLLYLHQSGDILRFSSSISDVEDMVVLDPMWLISVCQEVFHHDLLNRLSDIHSIEYLCCQARIYLSSDDIKYSASLLKGKGILSKELLSVLWYPWGVQSEIFFGLLMSFFQQFGLAYSHCDEENNGYLFPWLLEDCSSDQPCDKCSPQTDPLAGITLIARYSFRVTPLGFFERFLVQLKQAPELEIHSIKRHLFDACFGTPANCVHGHRIVRSTETIVLFSCSLSNVNYIKCVSIMKHLVGLIDGFLKDLHVPTCLVSKYIQCPGQCVRREDAIPGVIKLKKFLSDKMTFCPKCQDPNDDWRALTPVQKKLEERIQELDESPGISIKSPRCLCVLSKIISCNWKKFGKKGLNYENSILINIEQDDSRYDVDCAYNLLMRWCDTNRGANFASFYSAIKKSFVENLHSIEKKLLECLEKDHLFEE